MGVTGFTLKINNEYRLTDYAFRLSWLYNNKLDPEDFKELFTRFLEGEGYVESSQNKEPFEYGFMSRRLRLVDEARFFLQKNSLQMFLFDHDLITSKSSLRGVYIIRTEKNGVTKIEPDLDTISKVYCHPEVSD